MAATDDNKLEHAQSANLNTVVDVENQHHAKRKREDQDEEVLNKSHIAQFQRNLLGILSPLDIQPSLLRFQSEKSKLGGPSLKKARVDDESEVQPGSIYDKLENASYTSLEAIKEDVSRVADALANVIRESEEEMEHKRTSVATLKQLQQTQRFRYLVNDLVDNETSRCIRTSGEDNQSHAEQGESFSVAGPPATDRLGSVLTLFGNAPTPKQLFSSMQTAGESRPESLVRVPLAVEEMGLPIGISVTNVFPVIGKGSSSRTFSETFPPPRTLPALLPPKSHRRTSTRDGAMIWEFRDSTARNSRKGGWTVQSQTAGGWLGYGGASIGQTADSPKEKRKQRDRALSGGESTRRPANTFALIEAASNEEKALFRRAYSAFAPSFDDSKALVPAEVKSTIWWHETGQELYNETFALDPALRETSAGQALQIPKEEAVEDLDFGLVLPELDQSENKKTAISFARDDLSDILGEVSQLLETLASHQRIRHATLPSAAATTARTPISPAPLLAAKVGLPDAPAEEEITTYQRVKHELARLLLRLPPYALAKLDGDRFAELGVGSLITFRTSDVEGTLEEDLPARLARYSASVAAASHSNHHRSSSSSGQHYNSTAQRTPAIGQAANTRYGQQYAGVRTPTTSHQYQRTPSHGQISTPTMAARSSYNQSMQHGRASVGHHSSSQQFSNSRPPSYGATNGYGAAHQQALPNTRPNYALSQPLAQYQNRAHIAAQNTVGLQQGTPPFNGHRTTSPVKPMDYMQHSMNPKAGYSIHPPQSTPAKSAAGYTPQSHVSVNGSHLSLSNGGSRRESINTPQPVVNGHS